MTGSPSTSSSATSAAERLRRILGFAHEPEPVDPRRRVTFVPYEPAAVRALHMGLASDPAPLCPLCGDPVAVRHPHRDARPRAPGVIIECMRCRRNTFVRAGG